MFTCCCPLKTTFKLTQTNITHVVLRLSAEKDSEVTFDEVVTARKQRSQQYKRQQCHGRITKNFRDLNIGGFQQKKLK